jgi:hypothetical protein
VDARAAGRELALERPHEVGIRARHQAVERLDDRDLGPERGVYRRELEADDAAADDEEPRRHVGERERGGRVEHARVVRPAGQSDGTRARRDDRMLEVDRDVALRRRDAHLLRAGEGAGARHDLDAARLRELRESTRELPDDAVLVCAELREVELRRAELDAGVGEPARRGEHLRDVQQRLGRDAADVQADAAERGMALDQHDRAAEIRGAERRGVAAGSGAEHEDVGAEIRHQRRIRRRSPSSAASRVVNRAASAPSITRWS